MPTDAFPARALRLAVLIDGENASARKAELIFTEIAKRGEISGRRIYGDAASPTLKAWVDILPRWAIQWQQNFQNTKGKNSGDIAMVIDAMDLLHSGRFDGFCLVSSDSDFTRLAIRIREQGLPVYGYGQQKTPESFRNACNRFIYIQDLTAAAAEARGKASPSPPSKPRRKLAEATQMIAAAITDMDSDGGGWATMGGIGNRLRTVHPDFQPRAYGYPKLSDLIGAIDWFAVETPPGGAMRVRLQPR